MQTLEREQTSTTTPFPHLKRWTATEFEAMRQQNLLQGKHELIEGMVYKKMGSGTKHSRLICALFYALLKMYTGQRIWVQLPIRILGEGAKYNAPEPDVMVTKEDFGTYTETPTSQDVLLAAEISDSSLPFDLSTKANLYSSAGIAEYWVVDVEGERLLIHREPSPEGYRSIRVLYGEDVATPLSSSNSLIISELFAKLVTDP